MSKIVYVEPSSEVGELIYRNLSVAGHDVVWFKDSRDALNYLEDNKVKLLITALRVNPQMSGVELIRRVKELTHLGNMSIIVLSNVKNMKIVNKLNEMGISLYINKNDVTPSDISEVVNETISKDEHINSEPKTKKSDSVDLLKDTFVSKMPDWLRWVLVLPSSVIAAIIIPGLFMLFAPNSDTLNEGWFRLVQSGLFGGLFVAGGAFVAPKNQLYTSVLLLVLITIIVTLFTAIGIIFKTNPLWYLLMHGGTSLIGGGVALASIKEALE